MKMKRGMLIACILAAAFCAGCKSDVAAAPAPKKSAAKVLTPQERLDKQVESYLNKMTLEEKAAQLFLTLPEPFMKVDTVTAAGEMTKSAMDKIPVGGFIYMEPNLQSEEQVKTMLANVQSYSEERIGLPAFTCVDEEGGTVARINGRENFDVPPIGNMSEIGSTGDSEKAHEVGKTLGKYLSNLGFNVDFAPDADVLSNPDNQIVKDRSFGEDPKLVADMSLAALKGLKENGVCGVLKHFPGHGATEGDTHEGYAYTSKTLKELQGCELVPFQKGIQQGADFIMVGHISLPNVTGDDTPASLSKTMITDVLRKQMGYDGIVVTDAMNMGAVVQSYTSSEAALQAITAGADLILMPEDFESAYQGILEAVKNKTLSAERIDQSLRRILRVKRSLKKG